MDEEQKELLIHLVYDLVSKNYTEIISSGRNGRLSLVEIEQALNAYPGKLTIPPVEFVTQVEYYPRSGFESIKGSGEARLWYDNEESDISILCDFEKNDGAWRIYIDVIHLL